jgi:hypothetical protein
MADAVNIGCFDANNDLEKRSKQIVLEPILPDEL